LVVRRRAGSHRDPTHSTGLQSAKFDPYFPEHFIAPDEKASIWAARRGSGFKSFNSGLCYCEYAKSEEVLTVDIADE
jgi:hypothetical protein